MKKLNLFFVLTVICNLAIYSQSNINYDYFHNISHPQSPNAASLGQYGACPVGHYTGTPKISIPFYEIEFDGMTIPISLSYHASGIKVRQESSSVGLGWAINAGGCITKEVRGRDDFPPYDVLYKTYYSDYKNLFLGNELYIKYTYDGYPIVGGALISSAQVEESQRQQRIFNQYARAMNDYDGEPDLFYYNLINSSGSMLFNTINTSYKGKINSNLVAYPIMQNVKEYTEIEYDIPHSVWRLRDNRGFRFYFSSKETTETHSNEAVITDLINEDYSKSKIESFPGGNRACTIDRVETSWLLDSIVSPNGKIAKFIYEDEAIVSLVNRSDIKYVYVGTENFSSSLTSVINHYGEQWANTNASYSIIIQKRIAKILTDEYSVYFDIDHYSKRKDLQSASSQYYPDQDAYNITGIRVMNIQNDIIKSWKFKQSYTSSSGNVTKEYRYKRLQLDEILDNLNNRLYAFRYNDNVRLPDKDSKSVDHWGYFNNGYHTGGAWSVGTGGGKSNCGIPTLTCITSRETMKLEGSDKSPNGTVMSAGMLTAIVYPTGGETRFVYEPNVSDYGIGGGLRVSQIYDITDGVVYNNRFFHYIKSGSGGCSGLLMTPLCYWYNIIPDADFVKGYNSPNLLPIKYIGAIKFYSNYSRRLDEGVIMGLGKSGVSIGNSTLGNVVGYSRVEEWLGKTAENGKIVYEFENKKDRIGFMESDDYPYMDAQAIPGMISTPYPSNGNLLTKTYYDDKGNPLRTIENFYDTTTLGEPLYGFKIFTCPPFEAGSLLPRFFTYESNWTKLGKTIYKEYFNEEVVESQSLYNYDPNYYMLIQEVSNFMSEDQITKKYRYPVHITKGVYPSMVEKGMLAIPIEISEIKNNTVINENLYTFDLYDNFLNPTAKYILHNNLLSDYRPFDGENVGSKFKKEIEVVCYNSKGNILEYIDKSGIHITLLWSYNYTLPIAEIKNAKYSDLVSALSENTIDMIAKEIYPDKYSLMIQKLSENSLLKEAHISAFFYRPHIGLKREISPNMIQKSYGYDFLGRLTDIFYKDKDGNGEDVDVVLEHYKYHYRQ